MKILYIMLIFLVISLGCNTKTEELTSQTVDSPTVKFDYNPKLKQFSSCEELENRFKNELARKFKREYYWNLKSSYVATIEPGGTTATAASAEASDSSSGAAKDYSETNVQEKGVDEGDIVKTDGQYIYLIQNNHFIILDVRDPFKMKIISDIDLSNQNESFSELYLYQNNIAIISHYYQYQSQSGIASISGASEVQSSPRLRSIAYYPDFVTTFTRIRAYDKTDPAAPLLKTEFLLPGVMSGSRLLGGGLFLVHSKNFELPNPAYAWDFNPGEYQRTQKEYWIAYREGLKLALEANLEKINQLKLADFWPTFRKTVYINGTSDIQTDYAVECSEFYIPESGNGNDLGMVTRIDLNSTELTKTSSGVMTSWGTLYMSLNNLYLISGNRWLWIMPMTGISDLENPEPLTGIHKFDISSNPAGKILYKGSGLVKGWVNNQFSLSEYQGYLRLGTTRGGWSGENLSNQLVILGEENGGLKETAKIDGLAPGERIYSMRYDGSRGYMVTFRRTDPLYTFDLSDPYAPKLMGELKVTGFSTYIHLFGENNNRLLTIGRSADATGRVTGNQLQIFDVSDLAAPLLLDSYELGSGWSEALYDHHAFLYYKSLLAIPYSTWTYNSFSSGMKLFTVGESKLSAKGNITHPDVNYQYYWYPNVNRALVIGNYIYTISGRCVQANNLEDLATAASVELPDNMAGKYYVY